MTTRRPAAAALLTLALLAGCNKNKEVPPPPEAVATRAVAGNGGVEVEGATPLRDRVATLGLLNKRNNITQTFTMKPGESKRFGNAVVRLASCERTPPWESPPETGAFVQLFVEERATVREQLAWHKIFSGWLFKNSPSLNVVEHPVYDVWVKDCTMHFPGEAEASDAAKTKAAKPSGKATKPSAPKPAAKPEAPEPAAKPEAPEPAAPAAADPGAANR